MATLDFTELDKRTPGEALEGLARLIAERLGMVVQWTGRGADGGRDMIFVETQAGPIKSRPIRWLVSCKDNSVSNSAVSEKDVGSIRDKTAQHECQGFLLVTTTTASTGLKERLDRLDDARNSQLQTDVWDRFKLTQMLLHEQFADLFGQFFPKQKAQATAITLDKARKLVEASLPRVTAGGVRASLVSYGERLASLAGEGVWPHDKDQARLIDELKLLATSRTRTEAAARRAEALDFDAFMAFVDALIRNFPANAKSLLLQLGKHSDDSALLFNVIQILREYDDFTQAQEMLISARCDTDTLQELYGETISEYLSTADTWSERAPRRALCLDDYVIVEDVSVFDLGVEGGDGVSFEADVELHVYYENWDPDIPPRGPACINCKVLGYLDGDDVIIEKVE